MSLAERHWYRLSLVSVLLFPFSLLFGFFAAARRLLYRAGVLPTARLPVPVIVVGNLTVGGTGKTPLVLWIAESMREMGKHPGILIRGYGGAGDGPRPVGIEDDAALVGDEALLLAERSRGPVWVGADRAASGRGLLAAHPECDLVICDDGLQHYGLARDVEIAVVDERGLGNGLLLPAGPLREPAGRRVDATVVNGGEGGAGNFRMALRPVAFFRVDDPATAVARAELLGKKLHAVAGIGNPGRFFAELERMGLVFLPHAFPDHHPFTPPDLEFAECDIVLMTEKDAVKCRHFGRRDLVALRVDAEPDPALAELIWSRIDGRATA
jgi:tetraacyldisaccharide 4'-kinase